MVPLVVRPNKFGTLIEIQKLTELCIKLFRLALSEIVSDSGKYKSGRANLKLQGLIHNAAKKLTTLRFFVVMAIFLRDSNIECSH